MTINYLSPVCVASSRIDSVLITPYSEAFQLFQRALNSTPPQQKISPEPLLRERLQLLCVALTLLIPVINLIAILILRQIELPKMNSAATKIQIAFRNYRVRKEISSTAESLKTAKKAQAASIAEPFVNDIIDSTVKKLMQNAAATKIQSSFRNYRIRKEICQTAEKFKTAIAVDAASIAEPFVHDIIDSAVEKLVQNTAATTIQSAFRNYRVRKEICQIAAAEKEKIAQHRATAEALLHSILKEAMANVDKENQEEEAANASLAKSLVEESSKVEKDKAKDAKGDKQGKSIVKKIRKAISRDNIRKIVTSDSAQQFTTRVTGVNTREAASAATCLALGLASFKRGNYKNAAALTSMSAIHGIYAAFNFLVPGEFRALMRADKMGAI